MEKAGKKSVFKIISEIIQWLFLALGIVFIAFVFVFASNPPGKNTSGSLFGFETRLVVSSSMDAEDSYYSGKDYAVKRIQVGSLVIIKDAPVDKSEEELKLFYDEIKVNDVLTFATYGNPVDGENIVTHRVVDITKDKNTNEYIYVCHGDAVDEDQLQYVYEGNVIGKVIATSKLLGDLYQNVLSNKIVIMIIILIPAGIIVVFEVRKIVKAVGEETKLKKESTITKQSLIISEQEDKVAELERKIKELEKYKNDSSINKKSLDDEGGNESND